MSTEVSIEASNVDLPHELSRLRKHWWWLLLLGCLLVLCGVIALAFPFLFSIGIAVAIGTVLLISGFATIISAFWTGQWSGFLIQLLVGILYVVLGMAITDAPVVSVMALTMLAASLFIVAGIFRITAALILKFPQWGWTLLNGVITTLLGVIIFRHFPEAGLWLVGTLIGIDLMFNGVSWIMLSLSIRSLPNPEDVADDQSQLSSA